MYTVTNKTSGLVRMEQSTLPATKTNGKISDEHFYVSFIFALCTYAWLLVYLVFSFVCVCQKRANRYQLTFAIVPMVLSILSVATYVRTSGKLCFFF